MIGPPPGTADPAHGIDRHDAADRWERTAGDTAADDCAEGFLGELDEVLWIMRESRRTDENLFRHAARKADHITELRRLLRRLHEVLVEWEEEAAAASSL